MKKKKIKPYQYRMRPVAAPDVNYGEVLTRHGSEERLTGQIGGMKASDLEERVHNSLQKLEIPSEFRVRITSEALGMQRLTHQFANVRGETEIDFLASHNGRETPIFVDGQIAHFMTPAQADHDKQKVEITDLFGKQFGWRESVRIPFWKLIDQNMTDRTVRDVFGL